MSVDKLRSPDLLRMAAGEDCTIRLPCCITGPCVSAHSNQAVHGKGKSVKADDCYIAFACDPCHREIDQGKNLTREQKFDAWNLGFFRTVKIIVARLLQPATSAAPAARKSGKVRPPMTKIVPRRL